MSLFKYLNEHTIPLLIAVIFSILSYMDSRINSYDRTPRDYFKGFVIIYILSYISIYIYNNHVGGGQSGGGSYKSLGTGFSRDDIFTGNPSF